MFKVQEGDGGGGKERMTRPQAEVGSGWNPFMLWGVSRHAGISPYILYNCSVKSPYH